MPAHHRRARFVYTLAAPCSAPWSLAVVLAPLHPPFATITSADWRFRRSHDDAAAHWHRRRTSTQAAATLAHHRDGCAPGACPAHHALQARMQAWTRPPQPFWVSPLRPTVCGGGRSVPHHPHRRRLAHPLQPATTVATAATAATAATTTVVVLVVLLLLLLLLLLLPHPTRLHVPVGRHAGHVELGASVHGDHARRPCCKVVGVTPRTPASWCPEHPHPQPRQQHRQAEQRATAHG